MTSQKISLARARTGSSREPVRTTTSSSPPAAAIRLKSSRLQRVVGPALDLAGEEVAGQQDDRRADQRGHDGTDLSAPSRSRSRVRSRGHLDHEFPELLAALEPRERAAALRRAARRGRRPARAAPRGRAPRSPRTPAGCPASSRECSTGARTAAGGRARPSGRTWRRRSRAARPAGARGASPASVASPTLSTTTSAPRPPVAPPDLGDDVVRGMVDVTSAPRRRAASSLASEPLVTTVRRPGAGRSAARPARRRRRCPRSGRSRPAEARPAWSACARR